MSAQKAYANLLSHIKKTTALEQTLELLGWDQETMMPKAGTDARAEQLSALTSIIHGRKSDPQIAEWLSQIDANSLDKVALANVREAKRSYDRAAKVPSSLAETIAKKTALAQNIWAKARGDNDFKSFAPVLDEIIQLRREEAACLTKDGDEVYDALLDEYEPGMKTRPLADLLGKLRAPLAELRGKITEANHTPVKLTGQFPVEAQMEMAKRLASVFNYDWSRGRLDKSVHPFSTGYRTDARITTRVNPDYVYDCLYSTVHEVGHANYEQGRLADMDLMPAGSYASMGIHESQSRMLENQIGRSRPFMDWLLPQMIEVFGDIGISTAEQLYRAVNNVQPGFIRTEADEVHYNLHVLMRFDLELALIRGDLTVNDLEAAWNDRFEVDFGQKVDVSSNGVLQDVHWSVGLFGYFPTYSLGNIYAAEQFEKMGKEISNRDQMISEGNIMPISEWLNHNIHQHGHVYSAPQLMHNVIGKQTDEKALVRYLNNKFLPLYSDEPIF